MTLCYELRQTRLEFWHIQDSIYSGTFRLIQVYLTPFKTLAYSKPCHITSPSIFKIRDIFKTLWSFEQAYSEPCQSQNGQNNLFRHYSATFKHMQKPCIRLTYADICHNWNPEIFRTPSKLPSGAYPEPCHIYENR